MKHRAAFIAAVVIASMVSMGCSSYKESSGDPDAAAAHEAGMNARVQETITAFRTADPSLSGFFDNAYGYAVFPKIAKGGAGLGGAHGEGDRSPARCRSNRRGFPPVFFAPRGLGSRSRD